MIHLDKIKTNKYVPVAFLALIVLVICILGAKMLMTPAKSADNRVEIQGARASMNINKEYTYSLTDGKGKELTKFTYKVDNAELRDQIIVQGKPANAIKGKTFLIVSIKITNPYDRAIDINAKDYVRLTMNGQDKELIAADIHNDPITIQPVSTKLSRLGFPINDTDKKLKLVVGEIKGTKDTITLTLP